MRHNIHVQTCSKQLAQVVEGGVCITSTCKPGRGGRRMQDGPDLYGAMFWCRYGVRLSGVRTDGIGGTPASGGKDWQGGRSKAVAGQVTMRQISPLFLWSYILSTE